MRHCLVFLNQYLLIAVTLAFGSGVLMHHFLPLSAQKALLPAVFLLLFTLFFKTRRKPLQTTAFLLLTIVSLGYLHTANIVSRSQVEPSIHSRIGQEKDAVLTGTLHRMVEFDGRMSTALIKSHRLRLKQEDLFSPVRGLVRLRLKGHWPESLQPGDQLIIRCTLSRPYRFGNPGGFDYPAFLAAKGIRITGKISSTTHIRKLSREQSLLHTLRYLPERIRLNLRNRIDAVHPPQEAGIYRALLIGDRSAVDKGTLEAFKASGVMHILAIKCTKDKY